MTDIFNSCLRRISKFKVCVASWRRDIAKFLRVKLLSVLIHIVGIALTRIYSTTKLQRPTRLHTVLTLVGGLSNVDDFFGTHLWAKSRRVLLLLFLCFK